MPILNAISERGLGYFLGGAILPMTVGAAIIVFSPLIAKHLEKHRRPSTPSVSIPFQIVMTVIVAAIIFSVGLGNYLNSN